MRIAQEEIFGPVQCCMPWRDTDEVSNVLFVAIADDFGITNCTSAAHHAVQTHTSIGISGV